MKISIVIACVALTVSCKADSGSLNSDNWLAPECSKADTSAAYLDTADMKFGVVDGDQVCVSGPEERVQISPSVKFLPKKSGLNKIEFECDREKASLIFGKHHGEHSYLVIKGKLFGAMRIPEIANDDWCTISAPIEFSDALALCETIADGMGLDKAGCAKPCAGDEKVCAVVKESP